jgi:hypothetical protein
MSLKSPPRNCAGWMARWSLTVLLVASWVGMLSAQEETPPAGGGGVILQEDVSGHYFEWVLAAIGVGVATFAVCRSSRRN